MAEKLEPLPTSTDATRLDTNEIIREEQTDSDKVNSELAQESHVNDDDSGDEFVDAMDSLELESSKEPIQHIPELVDEQGFLKTDQSSDVDVTDLTKGADITGSTGTHNSTAGISIMDGARGINVSSISDQRSSNISQSSRDNETQDSGCEQSARSINTEESWDTPKGAGVEECITEALGGAEGEAEGGAEGEMETEEKVEGEIVTDIDEEALKERDETLSEEEKQSLRDKAQDHKEGGNQAFKSGEYDTAVSFYTDALTICPICYIKERSIMYSNRGACRLKQGKDDDAIHDSTKALELNPNYLKALLRRAELYEKTDKLDEALADYQKAMEMDPGQRYAWEACKRLPEQINERNEKMKTEMMGKLKDLGNLVLKPFGMSTENFKFQQDPNTGSYSVNFQQNPQPE